MYCPPALTAQVYTCADREHARVRRECVAIHTGEQGQAPGALELSPIVVHELHVDDGLQYKGVLEY